MKVPNTEMMRRANAELLAHNQRILVVRWSGKEVEFNNGTILKNNAIIRFKRRIFNNSSDLWKVHHDEIIKNPAIADEVRQVI